MISVNSGERVYLKWELPFTNKPESHVILPTSGDELSFTHNNLLSASFNRVADNDVYWLGHENGKWVITFDTNDTSFLLPGENSYEFVVLGKDQEVVVSDNGTVFLNE